MTYRDVLHFWLEEVEPKAWYLADGAVDAAIRERFSGLFEEAMSGRLGHWLGRPDQALALLILLDQFSRNLFRGEARAFAADPLARRVAKRAITLGHDLATPLPARQFFYLPLMHSESSADQHRCVRLMLMRLADPSVPGSEDPAVAENLRHAGLHRDVIRRFGRFPSRNAALGRRDTAAEIEYRAAKGYMS